jgi:hypothetical protein
MIVYRISAGGEQFAYVVRFHHDVMSRVTECVITKRLNNKFGEMEACKVGAARAAAQDQFNKKVGRRISLERALSSFQREERAAIWEAYWKAHRKP